MNNTSYNDLIVTIQCLVYNHEPYLRQCLDGFVMQKTNFRFEAIVHDDASTDGSAAIILEYAKKYPNIIKAIIETENQYSKKNGSLGKIIRQNTHGKYIALCEGDDYWTDPLKLQKQVNILEENENIGMCYSKANVFMQNSQKIVGTIGAPSKDFKSLLLGINIPTLTVMYRSELLSDYYKEIDTSDKGWLMGDYPLWLWISMQKDIYFCNEITAVYRHLSNSASHSTDIKKQELFNASFIDMRRYFQQRYLPNENMDDIFYDDFYKRNALYGITTNNRKYCYNNIRKVKNKRYKEYLKFLLSSNPITFILLRKLIMRKL